MTNSKDGVPGSDLKHTDSLRPTYNTSTTTRMAAVKIKGGVEEDDLAKPYTEEGGVRNFKDIMVARDYAPFVVAIMLTKIVDLLKQYKKPTLSDFRTKLVADLISLSLISFVEKYKIELPANIAENIRNGGGKEINPTAAETVDGIAQEVGNRVKNVDRGLSRHTGSATGLRFKPR